MTTAIELKEQMKVLRQQQREADKILNKKKREYKIWTMLMEENPAYSWVYNNKDKYPSFEAFITDKKLINTRMSKADWEFMFSELSYTDIDFFTAFISWNREMNIRNIVDRKCCVCLEYYNCNNANKSMVKFVNCIHTCCGDCKSRIKKTNGYKTCPICRESEAPK